MIIELDAEITEDGELKVTLPEGIPPGKVHLKIEAVAETEEVPPTWTAEEVKELMLPVEPMTPAEIVAAGLHSAWESKGIEDSEAWVREKRQARRQRRGLSD